MISIAALAIVATLMAFTAYLDYRKFKLELDYQRF